MRGRVIGMGVNAVGLREYLEQKRAVLLEKLETFEAPQEPLAISAQIEAVGRSGVRRIRIRGHEILNDTGPGFAGYDLGPTSPELQLGILGGCMVHIFLIQAA
ncbi:MAG: OsmC family protein, partial [Thermomicrobiales bacterium]